MCNNTRANPFTDRPLTATCGSAFPIKGQLRTLSILADIEIVPNRSKNGESQPPITA
jgi:uncharacterized protein (DUF736 family)